MPAPSEPAADAAAPAAAAAEPAPARGPLAGVRVLDLTSVVLGPMATQLLGDYGADVIKVESLEGDLMRANGVSLHPGMSSIFLAINRNKRSLAIDLKAPAGVAALKRLLPTVDVLVHNMRVAAIERLGLGYAACAAVNPRLVYCVATGYGEDGPDAGKPAFDDVIQAACGLAALLGHESGTPAYVPSLIADKTTGLALANAVLAALFERTRSGTGQQVEVPMLETMAAFVLAEHLGGRTFEPAPAPAGYARLLAGGRRPAPTRDGHVALLPYTAAHWTAFFARLGRDDLARKYDIQDRHARNRHVQAMYAEMAALTATMTTDECLALCRALDIPATRIYTIEQLPEHPHLQAVGLFERSVHPTEGPIVSVRPPARFGRTPTAITRPAPVLGEHTEPVLREAGFTADELAALRAAHVIPNPPTTTTETDPCK